MTGEEVMNRYRKNLILLAVAALLVAALIVVVRLEAAQAQPGAGQASAPRYSVVETQGHNLIVTDNKTNTLYFYTIDKDKEIGSELKLRGTMDLNQVGMPSIKPIVPKKAG
jgi:hypothetical protein